MNLKHGKEGGEFKREIIVEDEEPNFDCDEKILEQPKRIVLGNVNLAPKKKKTENSDEEDDVCYWYPNSCSRS